MLESPAAAIALSSGICLVPIITFLLALWDACQVFHLLGTRPIFDLALPRRLLRLGSLASAAAISGIVARPLVVLVLTRGNPPGQQQLVIGISSEEIAGLIMGLLCYTFALIIQEAIGIELENRGFV